MTEATYDYADGDVTCEAFVATPNGPGPFPTVLVAHQWAGQSDAERDKARALTRLGYAGIAIDVYGKGRRGNSPEENTALMTPFMQDRAMLQRRLLAAVAAAKQQSFVDVSKLAMLGYCFGGLCCLDIARSGTADLRGVVSLHGIFPPNGLEAKPIKAKILICHGWEDPLAPPQDVVAVAKELTDAGADWQLHAYGHAMHAFTAKGANDPAHGLAYNAEADRRSTQATENFLAEIFG